MAGTEFTWEFSEGVVGRNKFTGTGFFSGLSIEAADLQNTTIELPIEVTGEVLLVAYS